MKTILVILCFLAVLCLPVSSYAMGPLMVDAHFAVWNPNSETDLAGYYVYWRVQATPVNPWVNTQRSAAIAPSPTPRYDLLTLNLANGKYELCATAFDTAGNESGPSNIVPFVVDLPGAPASFRVQ